MTQEVELIIARLKECIVNSGYSYYELSKMTGIAKSNIQRYATGEVKKIPVDAVQLIARAVGISDAYIMGWSDVKSIKAIPNGFRPIPTTNQKPRLGIISCGDPIDTPENFDGYDEVPDIFDCDFTLVCEGDSMTGARICDGDIVYIKQQPTIENGQIAAVLIDGEEKLLKRVYITDESIILQAENPAYPPRSYHREDMNRVSIIGKVVGFTSYVK
jgi:repressor LexA